MLSTNIFEKATRYQIRFEYKGSQTIESLWHLKLETLDRIFKDLNSQAKAIEEESLLDEKSEADEILVLKIEVIKHIVKTLKEEQKLRENSMELRKEEQKYLELLQKKKDESLNSLSIEELEERLKKLRA